MACSNWALPIFSAAALVLASPADAAPFDTFNAMMKDVSVRVPNLGVNGALGEFNLTGFGILRNVHIDNMSVSGVRVSGSKYHATISVTDMEADLDGQFYGRFPYVIGYTKGVEGNGTMYIKGLSLDVELTFTLGDAGVPTGITATCPELKPEISFGNCTSHTNPIKWAGLCLEIQILTGLADGIGHTICRLVSDFAALLDPKLQKYALVLNDWDSAPAPVAPSPAEGEAFTPGLEDTMNFNTPGFKTAVGTLKGVLDVPGSGRYQYRAGSLAKSQVGPNPLVINELMDRVIGPQASLKMDLKLPQIELPGPLAGAVLDVAVKGVSLAGLDTFTDFDVADVLANHTLGIAIGLKELALSLSLEVNATLPDRIVVGGAAMTMDMTANVQLSGMGLGLNLVLGLKNSELADVEIGSLLNLTNLPACLTKPLMGINLTYLDLSMEGLSLSLDSTLVKPNYGASGGINALLNGLVGVVLDLYGESVLKALPYLSEEELRPLVDEVLQGLLVDKKPCEPPLKMPNGVSKVTDSSGDIEFPKSPVIAAINYFMFEVLDDFDSDFSINSFVLAALKQSHNFDGTSGLNLGTIVNAGGVVNQAGTPQDLYLGMINASITEMSITGINTFTNVTLVNPASEGSPYTLRNVLAFAGEDGSNSLEISFRLFLRWEGIGDLISNDIRMALRINDLRLGLDMDMKLNQERFDSLHLSDITTTSCLFAAMDGPDAMTIPVSSLSFGSVDLSVDCISCTGGAVKGWAKKLPTAGPTITKTLNGLFGALLGTLTKPKASAQLDHLQQEAVCGEPLPTPEPYVTEDLDQGKWVLLAMVVFTVAVILSLFIFAAYRIHRALGEETHDFMNYKTQRDIDDAAEDDASTYVGDSKWDTLRMGEAVFAHPVVPNYVRYGVPCLLVVLMGVMLSAHLYYNAVGIDYTLYLGGQGKLIDDYEYTTVKFTADAWDAGMQFLGFGIGFLSFSWAWIKIWALLWLFFVPPTVISHGTRTQAIAALDFLAKWSLLTTYLNLLLVPFVNIKLHPPADSPAWYDDLLSLRIQIDHYYGYYAFAVVQMLNLFCGQVIMFNNRNVVASVKKEFRDEARSTMRASVRSASSDRSYATVMWFDQGAEDNTREAMRTHLHGKHSCFSWCVHPDRKEDKRAPISLKLRFVVIFTLCCCLGLVVAGSLIECMGVRNFGLINAMIDVTPDLDTERAYNFFEMVKFFVNQSPNNGRKAANIILIMGIVLVALVIPILNFGLWLGMWFVPLKLSEQKKLYFIAECLASWSSLDVFILAVVLMTANVESLIDFATGNKMDGLNGQLIVMQKWGIINEYPAVIKGEGVWHLGIIFWIVAGVLSNATYFFLSAANRASIRDREHQAWISSLEKRSRRTDDLDDEDVESFADDEIGLNTANQDYEPPVLPDSPISDRDETTHLVS
eukprot:TRINITY_DN7678_c0_g2_i2.p1 TRINITY_DN7678_c0_g2~~TRINITY_DN7678_c0_g2_i2.p1  ORF type:complete len:1422 (+),score=589.27 TRINITY_DN7678_c0_g2_i2:207-4472(+)